MRSWTCIRRGSLLWMGAVPLILALVSGMAQSAALRFAEDQAPALVNPLFTTTMSEARLNELLFESLYTDNQELATVPQLVEAAELNADQTEIVLALRQDVRWHDGERFTADDVAFTIRAMKHGGTLSTEAGRVAWIKKVDVVDPHTVRLSFRQPEARPQDKLFFKILPEHRFTGPLVQRSDPFRTEPIGTGPWRLTRFNDDNSISLATHLEHWADTGIRDMIMREVSDKNYQAKLLMYESLEALVRVLPRDLAVLQADRRVELYPYQTNSWWYMGFNMKRAPFDEPAVRDALRHMVDLEGLLAPIGTGELLSGPFVRSSPFYNHSVRPAAPDRRAATALLQGAGFSLEDGRWTRDGELLVLRISAHKALESSQEVVINLQSQLQAAGVEVEVDFLDDALWKATIWRDREFDLILSQWSFDRNEDVREQFHSKGTRNFVGYANPEVDALLDRARDTLDPQKKKDALRALHAQVHADNPMIFMWTLDSYSAMSTRVGHVVIHPFYFFTWARDWTLGSQR
jgi:peptide/nickel transport system substrate-binding protein